MKMIKCPVCGQYEFEEMDDFDGCEVCHWQNDGYQYNHPDYWGGANDLSVNQHREAWEKKELPWQKNSAN